MSDNKLSNEETYKLYLKYFDKISKNLSSTDRLIIEKSLRNIVIHNSRVLLMDELELYIDNFLKSYKEKEIFSKNLKYYMDKKGLNGTQLANDLGIKQPTVRDWISGVNYPRIDNLSMLAEYFNIDKKDLTEPHTEQQNNRIPVVGKIPAGIPIEAIEEILDYEDIPKEWLNGDKEFFGLRIQGRSMYPVYLPRRYCYI
ncbi:MAG: helix-turn-helix domain-containing protein [Clostridiales bacterium]|nr:helix-turn-helix domain-containing protein [Clostridiales bacterium]